MVTIKIHGFPSLEDYHRDSSPGYLLPFIRTPLIAINSKDDPFIPEASESPPQLRSSIHEPKFCRDGPNCVRASQLFTTYVRTLRTTLVDLRNSLAKIKFISPNVSAADAHSAAVNSSGVARLPQFPGHRAQGRFGFLTQKFSFKVF